MRDKYLDALPLTRRSMLAIATAAIAAPAVADCKTTSRVTQGPYWRANAPHTNDIRRTRDGASILVRGTVKDLQCRPIAGATIDVWQADANGKYDLDYGRGETFLRGVVRSGDDGSYAFRTIRPAPYGLASSMRPAHIHFLIEAPGFRRLVTQLYFAGDPNLRTDPLSAVRDDLVVAVTAGEARFDITLG